MKCNFISGAIIALLGFVCVVYPIMASEFVEAILAVSLFIGAVLTFLRVFSVSGFFNGLFLLASSFICGIAGWCILANPAESLSMITSVLGILFLIEGVAILVFWRKRRGEKSNSAIMLLNGFLSVILGILVVANADVGFWFVGMLAGVDLLFTGLALMTSCCGCACGAGEGEAGR